MSIYDELIPGMANYMEDTEVSVEVSTSDAEAVAEAAEDTEAAVEVEAEAAENEGDAEQAEMVFRAFDDVERMHAFVSKYGVDRTFLYFHGHKLAGMNIVVPSMESFDTVGDPRSAVSVAAMEGLGDALKAVWEFIKKVCRKIRDFFKNLFSNLMARFGNIDKQIGRLKDALDEREVDEKKKRNASAFQGVTLEQITKVIGEAEKARKSGDSLAHDLDTAVTTVGSLKAGQDMKMTSLESGRMERLTALRKDLNKMKGLKGETTSVNPSDFDESKCRGLLNKAAELRKTVESSKATISLMQKMSDNLERLANQAATHAGSEGSDEKKKAKAAKDVTRDVNALSSAMGVVYSTYDWCARRAVMTVAKWVSLCTVKKGEEHEKE